jgi:hypothetical protein
MMSDSIIKSGSRVIQPTDRSNKIPRNSSRKRSLIKMAVVLNNSHLKFINIKLFACYYGLIRHYDPKYVLALHIHGTYFSNTTVFCSCHNTSVTNEKHTKHHGCFGSTNLFTYWIRGCSKRNSHSTGGEENSCKNCSNVRQLFHFFVGYWFSLLVWLFGFALFLTWCLTPVFKKLFFLGFRNLHFAVYINRIVVILIQIQVLCRGRLLLFAHSFLRSWFRSSFFSFDLF